MKDPTQKTEWVLLRCPECQRDTHFWRVRGRVFRCTDCEKEAEFPPIDHDRDGMLE